VPAATRPAAAPSFVALLTVVTAAPQLTRIGTRGNIFPL
jgi:hypothetical protein